MMVYNYYKADDGIHEVMMVYNYYKADDGNSWSDDGI